MIPELFSGNFMAYFAQIDGTNQVTQVISVNNSVVHEPDYTFPQTEPFGQVFISEVLKLPGVWKQTSYNKTFRKNYAGVGYTYDPTRDAFIPPKPYPSWTLDEQTCLWNPQVPHPNDGNVYSWDEESGSWTQLTNQNGG